MQPETIVWTDVHRLKRERPSPLCYANVTAYDWDIHCHGVLLRDLDT